MERWIILAAAGVALLACAGFLLATIDADCDANGSYGNYCGLQQPHVWGYPLAIVGVALLAGALVVRRRASRRV